MNYAKKTRILLLINILIMLGMSTTLSAQATTCSTISSTNTGTTWTDEKVQALVNDLKIEKNAAIDKAVQEATAPLIADLYTINIELDSYKSNWSVVEDVLDEYKTESTKLHTIIIFGGIGITVLAGLAGYGLAHIFS